MRRDEWSDEDSGSSYGGFQYRWNYDEYQKTLQRRRRKAAGRGLRAFCVTASFVFLLSFVSFGVVLAAAFSRRAEASVPPDYPEKDAGTVLPAAFLPEQNAEKSISVPETEEPVRKPSEDTDAEVIIPGTLVEIGTIRPMQPEMADNQENKEKNEVREELPQNGVPADDIPDPGIPVLPEEIPEEPQGNGETEESTVEAVVSLPEMTASSMTEEPVTDAPPAEEESADSADSEKQESGEEAEPEEEPTETEVSERSGETAEERQEPELSETEEPEPPVYASLGITVSAVSENDAALFRIPRGMMVESVDPEGNGGGCGLRRGDILLSADGEDMTSPERYRMWEKTLLAGQTLLIRLFRDGGEYSVSVTLSSDSEKQKTADETSTE